MTSTYGCVAVLAAAISCGVPHVRGPQNAPEPTFVLTVFDVGTGLSILIRGADFALLYDAGSNDDRAQGAHNRAVAYLVEELGPSGPAGCGETTKEHKKLALNHLILSHPHRDHVSLVRDIFDCFRVDHVWDSGFPAESKVARDSLLAARSSGAMLHQPQTEKDTAATFGRGTWVTLGNAAHFEVLHVDPTARDANDASIVLKVVLNGVNILLMGDATAGDRREPEGVVKPGSVEDRLIGLYGADLDADVLVVGHHGSKTSSRNAFIDLVSPSFALISSGPMKYGRVVLPDQAVVQAFLERGARVLRTDVDDQACREAPKKTGPDGDGSPGGCNAIRLVLQGGQIRVAPEGSHAAL